MRLPALPRGLHPARGAAPQQALPRFLSSDTTPSTLSRPPASPLLTSTARSLTGHAAAATARPDAPQAALPGSAFTQRTGRTPPSFDDTTATYAMRTTPSLLRSYAVLITCHESLVSYAEQLHRLSNAILGKTLSNLLIRETFFSHFCAGETEAEAKKLTLELHKKGVGGILDFAAEADAPAAGSEQVLSRQYVYESEVECDQRAIEFETSLRAAGKGGYAAVKLTALCDPELLKRASASQYETNRLFTKFTELANKENITREDFRAGFDTFFPLGAADSGAHSHRDADELFDSILRDSRQRRRTGKHATEDIEHPTTVDLLDWCVGMPHRQAAALAKRARNPAPPSAIGLSEVDLDLVDNALDRVSRLAWIARDEGCRLMIDAEHTYFQSFIDATTLELQRQHNCTPSDRDSFTNPPSAVVYATYQAYLKSTPSRLENDMKRAEREGTRFACKLVRGAYMQTERRLAEEQGREDPIQPDFEATSNSYAKCAELILSRAPNVEVVFATHNRKSVEHVLSLLDKQNPEFDKWASEGNLAFAQLKGMADHLTFGLAKSGFQAFKYLPFGKIDQVIPYLTRRAQENALLAPGAQLERSMIRKEIWRRVASGK